jgi:putative ABC transport system permease protein
MWQILLSEFWHDLKSQRTRVLLTGMGIACGTFIVVVLLALGEGVKRAVMSDLLGSYDNAIILYGGQTSKPYRGLPSRRFIRFEDDDMAAILREVPDVVIGSSVYSRWGARITVPGSRTSEEIELRGVDPSYAALRNITAAQGGRFLNERDAEERRRVVFLADSLARVLFPAGNALGNEVRLNNQPFTVVGVAPRKMQTSIEDNGDHNMVLVPAGTYKAVYNTRYPDQLLIRARDPQHSDPVQKGVKRVLAERHRFDPSDESAVYINDWAEEARFAWRIMTGIQAFMGMVGGLTLLVAAVGVANIMYVAVKERTQEVGIKLALGARSIHIVSQFIFEAILLCTAGGLVGLGAAGIAVALLNRLDPSRLPLSEEPAQALEFLLNPVISWPIGFTIVGSLVVIGFAAGVFPARRAAALDPVDSLRFE